MLPVTLRTEGMLVNINELIDALSNPGPLERPMPMWIWNGSLDHEFLEQQLDMMLAKHVRAFFIHPMPQEFRPKDFPEGLSVEYLGTEYMDALKHVVKAAADRDMRVWLYDEGGWPSGPNLGRVVAERPDLKGKVARYNEEGEVEILERGYPVDLLERETTETFIRQVHEAYAEAVGDHFGKTIVGFFTDEPRYAGRVGGAEIPWTPKLPEEFKARKGYDLSLGMSILFGLKASRSLPEDKRAQVICDFYEVVTDLWRENFFHVIRDWCHEHDLLFTGHLDNEDTLLGQLTNGGDFFRATDAFDWPGIDVISRQIDPKTDREKPNDFPKFASSSAHIAGRNRVLSESFAVYGWDLTPDEMRWVTNFQYVRGVNAIAPMAFHSDVTGPRKISAMSDQFRTNPLFDHYDLYADYVGRLGTLASVGKPVVNVGLYYPMRSLWTGSGTDIQNKFQTAGRNLLSQQIDFDYLNDDAISQATLDGVALTIGNGTYQALIFPAITTVSIETMRKARDLAAAGGIVAFLGDLPHLTCKAANTGEMNQILDDLRATAVFAEEGSGQDLALGAVPRTVRLNIGNPDIRASHRTTGEVDVYLLANESTETEHHLRVRFPETGSAYVYNPEDGSVAVAERVGDAIRVNLAPSAARAILLADSEIAASEAQSAREPDATVAIDGDWSVRMTDQWAYADGELTCGDPGAGDAESRMNDALALWSGAVDELPEAPSIDGSAGDVLKSWDELYTPDACGTAEYSVTFQLKDLPARVELDLGNVGVVARVELNGVDLGRRAWQPYRFAISDALRSGENTLKVWVTSTLHRLMSSERVVTDLTDRSWYNTYIQSIAKVERPSAPAGLIGPVRLLMWR